MRLQLLHLSPSGFAFSSRWLRVPNSAAESSTSLRSQRRSLASFSADANDVGQPSRFATAPIKRIGPTREFSDINVMKSNGSPLWSQIT